MAKAQRDDGFSQLTFDLLGEVSPLEVEAVCGNAGDGGDFASVLDGIVDESCDDCRAEDPIRCRVHGTAVCEAVVQSVAQSHGFAAQDVSVKDCGSRVVSVEIATRGDDDETNAQLVFSTLSDKLGIDIEPVSLPDCTMATLSLADASTKGVDENDGAAALADGEGDDDSDGGADGGEAQTARDDRTPQSEMLALIAAKGDAWERVAECEDEAAAITDGFDDVYAAHESDFGRMADIRRKLRDNRQLTEERLNEAVAQYGEDAVMAQLNRQREAAEALVKEAESLRAAIVKDVEEERERLKAPEDNSEAEDAEDARLTELSRPLPPIPHDESAFPETLTSDDIAAAQDVLGGSTGAALVEIGGRKYVMKSAVRYTGEASDPDAHIENEYFADCAYRANGILVPDCKLYEVDGRKVKLSEYIEGGISLAEFLADGEDSDDDEERQTQIHAVRESLLLGYPLDAYFGNWDVIGLDRDNILVVPQEDGSPLVYRIDNGSCFGFRSMGRRKPKSAFENRDFPDEWRSLRSAENNQYVFDEYTANDIFTSAAKFDWNAVYEGLPESLRIPAMKKCADEMRQMAERCVDHNTGGYGGERGGSSMMLEASYDLSKRGFREACPAKCGVEDGFGSCRTSEDGERLDDGSRSIVEMLHKEICREHGVQMPDYDRATGVVTDRAHPLSFLTRMLWQGGCDSWQYDMAKGRLVEVSLRGGDWQNATRDGRFQLGVDDVRRAVEHYIKHPRDLERDRKTLACQKAAMQLFLENTKVSGSDRNTRTLALVRTEGVGVVDYRPNNANGNHIRKGEFVRYPTSGCEAWSCGKRTVPDTGYNYGYGKDGEEVSVPTETMTVAVPFSRVVAGYWMERAGGHGKDCIYDTYPGGEEKSECEVFADTWKTPFPIFYSAKEGADFSAYAKEYRSKLRGLMRGYTGDRADMTSLRAFTRSWDAKKDSEDR